MKLSIILLRKKWFVRMQYEMLTHLQITKMIRFYQKAPCIFRGEYNENNESLNVNEVDVASSYNLKDMHRREVSPIGHSSWHGNE